MAEVTAVAARVAVAKVEAMVAEEAAVAAMEAEGKVGVEREGVKVVGKAEAV